MTRASIFCVALATGIASGLAANAAEQPVWSIAIAVAPMEHSSPPGAAVPDVETLLADRIGTKGVQKVVGPGELGVQADAEPDDETVVAWAKQVDVASVVVGRVTHIGNQMSVDVRLRSGETGEVVGTYLAEVLRSDQLEMAVDSLANQILDGAAALVPANAPTPPAASEPVESAFGFSFDGDRPISIRSDELESVKSGGIRRLLFTQNVVVTQDDLTIRSDSLEAFYPPKSSEPDRLVAAGRVRMTNGENEARCDKATYERVEDMLICRGNAELREGSDCAAGKWIEFDLTAETIKVGGGATVVIGGKNGGGARSGGVCR